MRKYGKSLVAAGIVFAIGLSFVIWTVTAQLLSSENSRFCHSSFTEIKIGMTLADVETIVGIPPGDYSTAPIVLPPEGDAENMAAIVRLMNGDGIWWVGNGGVFCIGVDRNGEDSEKRFHRGRVQNGKFLEVCLKWLRL